MTTPLAVADHPNEQGFEAWPALDRILAADSRIVELADNVEAGPQSRRRPGAGVSLSLSAPTFAAELVRK